MNQQQKNSVQRLFIGITVPLISLSLTFISLYLFMPRYESSSTPVIKVPQLSQTKKVISEPAASRPIQLTIPSISVAAPVNPVGITLQGNMDIDENPEQVAWYKLGPKPGERGSSVIAGHYGWKNGVASVFNDLNKLIKGNEVSIMGENGEVKTFIVSHSTLFNSDHNAAEVFTSDDGKAHLNLITCQGLWNKNQATYTQRLVVFTDFLK